MLEGFCLPTWKVCISNSVSNRSLHPSAPGRPLERLQKTQNGSVLHTCPSGLCASACYMEEIPWVCGLCCWMNASLEPLNTSQDTTCKGCGDLLKESSGTGLIFMDSPGLFQSNTVRKPAVAHHLKELHNTAAQLLRQETTIHPGTALLLPKLKHQNNLKTTFKQCQRSVKSKPNRSDSIDRHNSTPLFSPGDAIKNILQQTTGSLLGRKQRIKCKPCMPFNLVSNELSSVRCVLLTSATSFLQPQMVRTWPSRTMLTIDAYENKPEACWCKAS